MIDRQIDNKQIIHVFIYTCIGIFVLQAHTCKKYNTLDNKSTKVWVRAKLYWHKEVAPEGNLSPQEYMVNNVSVEEQSPRWKSWRPQPPYPHKDQQLDSYP